VKLLLDTHILIWARLSPEQLSQAATEALQDENNELWYSPISVWEILLLAEKKRLKINDDPYRWAERALDGTLRWKVAGCIYPTRIQAIASSPRRPWSTT
jgi:PIN domain nuclease of toxin-antitoxin system